ncbi:MAG: peptide-modifying radical SAM enzyme CbpB [Euryarchaeota archaeon]|nr:peptide-modifying radical SAM enzyme CbpB [Euryarchaeota archaeon]
MLQELRVGEEVVWFDPETCFWGLGERDKLEALHSCVEDELSREMHALRSSVEVVMLYVNPTDRCNASCPYCYLPAGVKSRGRSMSTGELRRVVEEALDFFGARGVAGSVVFHGSEPLLSRESIFSVIDEYRRELHFGIQTNGLLLTEEDAEFIRSRGVRIGISLDSPDEETNDALRGRGHFRRVSEALSWLSGYEGLSVVTTITRHNQGQLAEMVRFLHSRGVPVCLMNPVRLTQRGSLSLMPEPAEMAASFIRAVDTAIELTGQGRRIVVADFANLLLGITAPSARVLMCDISPCGAGRRFLSVAADGECYPCGEFIGMGEFSGGNIFRRSLPEVIDSRGFARVRARRVEQIEGCSTCPVRNVCGAPCPAELHSSGGSMHRRSHYCEFYLRVIEHAFRVVLRGDLWHVLRRSALREKFSL